MEESYKTILNRISKSRRDIIMNILTFIFPFLSVVAAFAFQKVYPIGDRVMMTVDSYHQYVPFLIEFRNKVIDGRSLFFSWNSGLGMEYFAAFSNYAASPLNLFCLFFTAKTMPVFVALITAVRAGLSGLFMSWFLTGEDEGRRDYITTAFSCAYALCGWFCTDFWNIMWCDALFLLPLVLLGLRKLFTQGKYAFYVISLALVILSNYYTGFFICMFLVIFAPIYYFMVFQTKKEGIVEGKLGPKTFFASAGRFALASLLAGGIAAVMIIPTYGILQSTSAVGADFPKEYELTGNLFDFLGRFLVSANPNIRDGMANVYTGIVPVLMVPLFFAADKSTGIKLRHKICMGLLLLIMYVSFTNRTLDFIWHGFHFPNQIPYRQSFLMSFLVVYVGLKSIRVLKSFTTSQVSAVFIGGAVFVILFEKFGSGNEGYIQILLSLLFVLIEGIIIRCTMTGKKSTIFYEIILSAFMAIEMLVSCCVSIGTVSQNEGFPLYKSYAENYDVIKEYTTDVEYLDDHKPFERTELYPNTICNIQSVYDVRGFSVFSSTVRENNVIFLRNFGFHNNGINSYRSAGMTKVTSTLLGVRNFISVEKTDSLPPVFEHEKTISDDVVVYGNKDALSVGYMVSSDMLTFEPDGDNKNVFEKTNALVNALGVEGSVYQAIPATFDDLENTTLSSGIFGQYTISVINSAVASKFTAVINTENTGADVYLYLDCGKTGHYSISKCDEFDNPISTTNYVSYRYYQIVPVGIADGSTYKVTFKFDNSPTGTIRVFSCELNQEVYNNMVDVLSSEQLEVTKYDDTSICGTITTENGGLMLMTVAYNDGYRLVVDGKKQDIVPVGNALVGVELTPGTHEIELYYVPAGFTEGLLISGISFAMFLLVLFVKFFGTKVIKHNDDSVAAVEATDIVASEDIPVTDGEVSDETSEGGADEPSEEAEVDDEDPSVLDEALDVDVEASEDEPLDTSDEDGKEE